MAKIVFAVLLAAIVFSLVAGQADGASIQSGRMLGAALLGLAAWLFSQDIARRTVHGQGLTRFIAVCLLSGYCWLAIGGAVLLLDGELQPGEASYDAALHTLLLGFVFSMVFGHAPIIFPAVLRTPVPYRSGLYVPLILLHASLLVRVAGDIAGRHD